MTTRRSGSLGARTTRFRRALGTLAAAAAFLLGGMEAGQDAVANGDTRTLHILHEHTKEGGSITFRRNGQYDAEALKQLNWLLRDWRLDEPTAMDPRLFDIAWQVYREVGAREPIRVVSAYRSPQTNAALRRRSRAVAEHSQHMRGKAMDFYIPEVSMARVREIGMRVQNGGVGFYPNAYNPFVHLDSGSVRSWPRMAPGELARLFPDGRTVHIPRNGKPLPGYEIAKAQILARGGSVAGYAAYADAGEETGTRKSLWATLFGGGEDEDADYYRTAAPRPGAAPAARVATAYATSGNSDDAGVRGFFGAAPAEEARPRPGPSAAAVAPLPEPEPAPSGPSGPLPPRRPVGMVPPLTVASGTAERAIPTALARLSSSSGLGGRGEMRTGTGTRPPGPDDRAALKTLFDAAATRTVPGRPAEVTTSRARPRPVAGDVPVLDGGARVRTVFSSAAGDEPSSRAFSGPAVAPLSTLR